MPGRFTWPLTPKMRVPEFLGEPILAYSAPPMRRMGGTAARVSTLFTVVGWPKAPLAAGKGGFTRGSPRRPSSEFSRAVSSPQM